MTTISTSSARIHRLYALTPWPWCISSKLSYSAPLPPKRNKPYVNFYNKAKPHNSISKTRISTKSTLLKGKSTTQENSIFPKYQCLSTMMGNGFCGWSIRKIRSRSFNIMTFRPKRLYRLLTSTKNTISFHSEGSSKTPWFLLKTTRMCECTTYKRKYKRTVYIHINPQ